MTDFSSHPVAKLRTRKLVAATFVVVRDHYRAMAEAAVVPGLACVLLASLIDAAGPSQSWLDWPLFVVKNVVLLAYAITCHRIILLGTKRPLPRLGIHFSRRELRYVIYAVTIGLVAALPVLFVSFAALRVLDIGSAGGFFAYLVMFAPGLVFGIIVSLRMGVALPLIAVDGPSGLRRNLGIAWQLMAGSTFKLFLAAVFVNAPIMIIFSILFAASNQIGSAIGANMPFLLASYLEEFISTAITATLLSVAFRTLTGFDGRTPQIAGADDE